MVNTYNRGFRSVYKLTVHLVLVTKYRKPVINREIMNRLDEIVRQTCQKWSISLVEFNGESDHLHLLIDYPPDVAFFKFVANLKTVTNIMCFDPPQPPFFIGFNLEVPLFKGGESGSPPF